MQLATGLREIQLQDLVSLKLLKTIIASGLESRRACLVLKLSPVGQLRLSGSATACRGI